MILDEAGWKALTTLLSDSLDRALEIQAECAERLTGEAEEEGFSASVTLLGFPTPTGEQQKAAKTL
jgi:hypothetical protein